MENIILEQLAQRRSVRAFVPQDIRPEHRAAILQAAADAPTAGCQQLYTILEITAPALKAQLADSCDHQPFIAKAPLVLLFCADAQKWYDLYRLAGCAPRLPGEGDLLLAVDDALIAAQNAVTAAWSLGIGSCYIGDIMEQAELHRTLLQLPEYVFPAALLVFGYPSPQQCARPKPQRCAQELIVQQNRYHRLTPEELRGLTESRAGEDFTAWTQAFCARKYNSAFAREMTRSVRRYLENYRHGEEETENL